MIIQIQLLMRSLRRQELGGCGDSWFRQLLEFRHVKGADAMAYSLGEGHVLE